MNKLSKTQRDQLLGIAAGALALMAALWYFGVTAKQKELIAARQKSATMLQQLTLAGRRIHAENEISATLHDTNMVLSNCEAGLAPERDTYIWMVNTMNNFVQTNKTVSIDPSSQPEISEEGLIPRFPYRWATFHLRGTGYYHDIGKFFADFENQFPYFRIQNPTLSINAGPGAEPEKLGISFDVVAPVANSGPDTK
jgi:hypothetical protein